MLLVVIAKIMQSLNLLAVNAVQDTNIILKAKNAKK